MSISFGVDRLIEQPALLGKISRVGLLTNNAARLASDAGRSSRSALLGAGIPVQRLFSPEQLGAWMDEDEEDMRKFRAGE